MAGLATTDLKLWIHPGACSLVPHILLREAGVSFELLKVPTDGRGISDEFRRINPKMRVPVLALGPEIVTELPAIATAIAQLPSAQPRHLMGRSVLDTVRVYEWLNWLSGSVHGQAFGPMIRPARFTDDEAAQATVKAKGMQKFKDAFAEIEQRLHGLHVVGDALTAPDLYLFVLYRWGATFEFDMRADYPKFTALAEALSKRPAVRAAVEAENIKLLGFPDESPLQPSL